MNIPILLVGAPGTGKTAITEQKYEYTEKLLTSAMVEEDISGLIYREGDKEHRTVPAFIERIQQAVKDGKKTCLFLDEVDKGRREVVDTLLTLITHQESYGIPKEVDIVMAANPSEWGGGDGVSIPMLNRVSVINFSPDIEKWCEWVMKKFNNNPFVSALADRISCGELPLLETTGEDLNRRTTSPRSITMAIEAYLSLPVDQAKQIADGLLTPNVSSSMYATFVKTTSEEDFGETEKLNLSATKVANKRTILRK